MREKIVYLILTHPKRILIISFAIIFALMPGLMGLKSDFSYRAWYSEDDPLLQQFDEFERMFGNDDSVIIAVEKDNLYNKTSLGIIFDLTDKMWKIPGIVRVDSLTNHYYVHSKNDDITVAPLLTEEDRQNITEDLIKDIEQKAHSNKLIDNFLISKDKKIAVLRGKVKPSLKDRSDNKEIIEQSRALIKEYREKYPDHKFYLAGSATFVYMFKEITETDVSTLLPLLYITFGIILFFLYRNKTGLFYPYLIIMCSIILMLSTSGFLKHSITTISSAAPSILVTIAIADAIHVLTVYFFGLKQGFSNHDAVRYSLTKNFYPTFLTSLTTAIGFFSFSKSLIKSIGELGVEVGIGVVFAWLATYFILGPLLVLRPKISKKVDSNAESLHQGKIETAEKNFVIKDYTKFYVRSLFNLKYHIILITIVISVGAFLSASTLMINLDPNSQFKEDYPYKVAFNTMQEHFGPMHQVELMINAGEEDAAKDPAFLNKVNEFDKWLNQQTYITKTISLLDIIKDVNRTLNNKDENFYTIPDTKEAVGQNLFFYTLGLPQGRDLNDRISLKSNQLKLTVVWDIATSAAANEKMQVIEAKAKEIGLDAKITGKLPLFHQLTPYVVSSFIQSFSIALISISIILIVVLKSLKLGLLALIPNIFPLLVGSGIYAYSGEYIDIASVLIVAVCLGIAVDDSIHFLFEYKKFRSKGYELFQTFEMIFTNTAPSLFNTTVLIVLGFGSFIVAEYIPNAKFGVMVSIILTIALLADFLILPAVLILAEGKKAHPDKNAPV